jgi:hypothetical protein
MMDTPPGPTGAMVVAAQDLLLETARVWWKGLFPDAPEEPKKKKGKVKGKSKGRKSKGKKSGSKKKKKR